VKRITAAEARKLITGPTKRNKFGAKKTVVDGITFDSQKEARRFSELKKLRFEGEIAELELQPEFILEGKSGNPLEYDSGRQIKYRADFRYFDMRAQIWVIEDAKGFKTRDYKIKKSIMSDMGLKVVET
jgi:hypothetical protein